MMLNWDMRALFLKILQDFADEAADDGWITETAPYVGIRDKGFGGRAGPISWALAVPELMDGLLRHYNETKALDYYPVCARYVRLVAAKCPHGIIPRCIGDHEALSRAPNDVTATAHWHRFVSLTSCFARRHGRKDDAAEFSALAEKIKAVFVAKFVRNGIVANGTQSAQAIALYLGLVPFGQIPAAEHRLLEAVREKGYAPTTGIFSTRYMLMYLSEHGRRDVAERIVLHKGFPGWLHMLERGATTLWETWRESDNVYSNCHPMFGSVDEWILRFAR
jgi:alpha-L-rhamnosidase